MKKIKVQFIGTFVFHKLIQLDDNEKKYFEAVALRIGLDLNEALLDPFFYYKLKLEKYQSYLDLNGENYFGLNTSEFHQIEIFVDGHKKQKFSYFDLNPANVLFPLYNTKISNSPLFKNQLVIQTKEKGSSNYTFQIQTNIPIDEILTFNLFEIEMYQLLSGIQVEEQIIAINRTDSVLIEQSVITY